MQEEWSTWLVEKYVPKKNKIVRLIIFISTLKILHGDLATRNILLAEDNIVKICDFGFAKTMYNSENYKKKSDKVWYSKCYKCFQFCISTILKF